jgi:hypothetical protein
VRLAHHVTELRTLRRYYATLTCTSFAGVIFGTTFLFTKPPPNAKGKSGQSWRSDAVPVAGRSDRAAEKV